MLKKVLLAVMSVLMMLPFPANAKDRVLPLKGAFNVRDLGGYPAANGAVVSWGKVFRSGDLHSLTEGDLALLGKCGIATVVDFRMENEREAEPHKLPPSVRRVVPLPVGPANMPDLSALSAEEAAAFMPRMNREMVNDAQEQYKTFFALLADAGNAPLLFNCSAGKDRTGFGAALFLSSLGVDRETVIADYLVSAACVKEKYRAYVEKAPHLAPAFTVRRDYIEAAFDEINKKYGGMDAYLTNRLGVDMEKMRALYTEKPTMKKGS